MHLICFHCVETIRLESEIFDLNNNIRAAAHLRVCVIPSILFDTGYRIFTASSSSILLDEQRLFSVNAAKFEVLGPLRILQQIGDKFLLKGNNKLVPLIPAPRSVMGSHRIHNEKTRRDRVEREPERVRPGKAKVGLAGAHIAPVGGEVAEGGEAVGA